MFLPLILLYLSFSFIFFFFNDTATTEIYTLSLHDALPISIDVPFLVVHREEQRDGLLRPLHRFFPLSVSDDTYASSIHSVIGASTSSRCLTCTMCAIFVRDEATARRIRGDFRVRPRKKQTSR